MFEQLMNSSPAGLWLSDTNGAIIYINRTLAEWTGMSTERLSGDGWADAIMEEDRERSVHTFRSAIATQSHYDVMFRMRKGNGDIIWCRAAGDPYKDEQGAFAGYSGYCLDMNELVAVSNELKAGEDRFRSIVEQAPMAIALLRGKEMIIEVGNDRIFEVWGKNKSVTGMKLMDALPEIQGQGFLELLDGVYTTGKPYFAKGARATLNIKNKAVDAYFDFTYAPLKDAEGKITGVMALAIDVTRQVLTQNKIQESEEQLRSFVNHAPFPIGIYIGREMRILLANQSIREVWGKGHDVVGKRYAELLPELDNQEVFNQLDQVYITGIPFYANNQPIQLIADGKPKLYYFNYQFTPLRDTQGNIYGVMNTAADVTDVNVIQRKIAESEARFRSLIAEAPYGTAFYKGRELIIETANEAMMNLWGRDSSVLNQPLHIALPELEGQEFLHILDEVFTSGVTVEKQDSKAELLRDGKMGIFYFDFIYKPIRNEEGKVYAILHMAVEVTDKVLARQKIEEAEADLRGAVELAELATWHIDLTTGILHYSPRLLSWCGFTPDEVITIDKAYSVIRESDRMLVKESMTKAITFGSGAEYNVEYTVYNATTKTEKTIHAQGRALFNKENKAYKVNGTALDVTQQRQIQLSLKQEVQSRTEELQALNEELATTNEELFESNDLLSHSNKELEQYAYIASHDLQEPLRKIRTFSDRLLRQPDLSESTTLYVDKISRSAERMSALINDLLEFSRLNEDSALRRPVDLTDVVNSVVTDFEIVIEEKKAVIHFTGLPVIHAIGLQMNQLFYNLLGNALKFSKSDVSPRIEIKSERVSHEEVRKYLTHVLTSAHYYRLTFSDNGIGFEAQYREQVFEIFKRLHTREQYAGSGIGLALCRRIILNHQGYMYAESIPGEGTTFHILLPDRASDNR